MKIFGVKVWPTWEDRALKTPKQLEFHYVSYATYPDMIECWRKGKYLGRFAWIKGHDAFKDSQLGRLYALWKAASENGN